MHRVSAVKSSLSILYVGSVCDPIERGTCLHRAKALRRLGHRVDVVDVGTPRNPLGYQVHRVLDWMGRPPDLYGANTAIRRHARNHAYDILWVDRGRWTKPSTLRAVRRSSPGIRLVAYSPDDMTLRGNTSPQFEGSLPLYDVHFTTKRHNLIELREAGARRVEWIGNGFDPESHRPLRPTPRELERFACDVGFVGAYEPDRDRVIRSLAARGIRIRIHGPGWPSERVENPSIRNERLEGLAYATAINATKINLGFLRKAARDEQTTRSVEIPACGGFLLAERTDEHCELFREGEEAEFFESTNEAAEKIRRYLADDTARGRVAAAGHRRCQDAGYSNDARMASALERVGRIQPDGAPRR